MTKNDEVFSQEELNAMCFGGNEPHKHTGYKHTGTVADDYSIQNIMEIEGLLDLGRTVAPVLCDNATWHSMIEARKKYWKGKHSSSWKLLEKQNRDLPSFLLMMEALEGYNEFCMKLVEAVGKRCKEKEAQRQKENEEFEQMMERIPEAAEGMREVMDKMFSDLPKGGDAVGE
jgi:hypothetical protein